MLGININCKNDNFIGMILDGIKIVETRSSKSLHPYIGKRVGLIETGKGRAMLWGFADITACYRYDSKEAFDNHSYLHRIYEGSEYYYDGTDKYGYVLENVERCEPRYVYSRGIVARRI